MSSTVRVTVNRCQLQPSRHTDIGPKPYKFDSNPPGKQRGNCYIGETGATGGQGQGAAPAKGQDRLHGGDPDGGDAPRVQRLRPEPGVGSQVSGGCIIEVLSWRAQ